MSKLIKVKAPKTKEDREQLADFLHNQVIGHINNLRKSTITLGATLKYIKEYELYRELDYDNFDIYCCSPELSLQPKTAKYYISIYTDIIEALELPIDKVQDIAINKLSLIRKTKEPKKWIEEARNLAYSDLKKHIDEVEFGIKSDDKEVQDYIKKQNTVKEEKQKTEVKHNQCPYYKGYDEKKKKHLCALDKF